MSRRSRGSTVRSMHRGTHAIEVICNAIQNFGGDEESLIDALGQDTSTAAPLAAAFTGWAEVRMRSPDEVARDTSLSSKVRAVAIGIQVSEDGDLVSEEYRRTLINDEDHVVAIAALLSFRRHGLSKFVELCFEARDGRYLGYDTFLSAIKNPQYIISILSHHKAATLGDEMRHLINQWLNLSRPRDASQPWEESDELRKLAQRVPAGEVRRYIESMIDCP